MKMFGGNCKVRSQAKAYSNKKQKITYLKIHCQQQVGRYNPGEMLLLSTQYFKGCSKKLGQF